MSDKIQHVFRLCRRIRTDFEASEVCEAPNLDGLVATTSRKHLIHIGEAYTPDTSAMSFTCTPKIDDALRFLRIIVNGVDVRCLILGSRCQQTIIRRYGEAIDLFVVNLLRHKRTCL